ncbi:MAG: 7-carboxy-7-deazaguanine synthase QueE [Rhodocyclaceae bacterium]|nr:7-carboxy-7-deazaguanine synthase QueE [Rhodocyclaceae bacterium]MBK6555040.1 7-carboxy-7-deazaguanine synthase QueE [Rhodocyclaceae bacterium]MBK6677010.1 7-carboxy-7-deazaguanine synthase QueE [Rhodocyclaceae bacterium]MBK7815933.1 7-carboxy-7-deazaguanine synthase QueE [Rhodocyclaceae bacterium]MBK9309679.1 7-carboxy-7-deazaguanine synthase QueE [Rhodocyclaceae bacterium]
MTARDEAAATLRVSEIFHSIQGESTRAGLPTTFIRLTGCPLRCDWCDTEHAFTGGTSMTVAGIVARVDAIGCPTVCVTGGEPLTQKTCLILLGSLCDAGYSVSLETSGALDIADVDPRVARIVDLKAPDSGESAKNLWSNLDHLAGHDELKFVLASEADYDWAKSVVATRRPERRCPVLFSPVPGRLDPAALAEWILRDRLPVRFQLQLHKILWGDERGR